MINRHSANVDALSTVTHVVPPASDHLYHTQKYAGSLTLCGMTEGDAPLHEGEYVDGYCTGCGRKACKTCEIIEWGMA